MPDLKNVPVYAPHISLRINEDGGGDVIGTRFGDTSLQEHSRVDEEAAVSVKQKASTRRRKTKKREGKKSKRAKPKRDRVKTVSAANTMAEVNERGLDDHITRQENPPNSPDKSRRSAFQRFRQASWFSKRSDAQSSSTTERNCGEAVLKQCATPSVVGPTSSYPTSSRICIASLEMPTKNPRGTDSSQEGGLKFSTVDADRLELERRRQELVEKLELTRLRISDIDRSLRGENQEQSRVSTTNGDGARNSSTRGDLEHLVTPLLNETESDDDSCISAECSTAVETACSSVANRSPCSVVDDIYLYAEYNTMQNHEVQKGPTRRQSRGDQNKEHHKQELRACRKVTANASKVSRLATGLDTVPEIQGNTLHTTRTEKKKRRGVQKSVRFKRYEGEFRQQGGARYRQHPSIGDMSYDDDSYQSYGSGLSTHVTEGSMTKAPSLDVFLPKQKLDSKPATGTPRSIAGDSMSASTDDSEETDISFYDSRYEEQKQASPHQKKVMTLSSLFESESVSVATDMPRSGDGDTISRSSAESTNAVSIYDESYEAKKVLRSRRR